MNQILNADDPSFRFICSSPGTLLFGRSTYLVSGPYLFMLFLGYFYHPPAGPWRWKRHIEAKILLPTNKGVFESLRHPESISSSVAGSPGHLSRSQSHFRLSVDRCHRPQSCARSGSNEGILIRSRTHQCKGLFLGEFARGFGPVRRHRNDLQRRCEPFL